MWNNGQKAPRKIASPLQIASFDEYDNNNDEEDSILSFQNNSIKNNNNLRQHNYTHTHTIEHQKTNLSNNLNNRDVNHNTSNYSNTANTAKSFFGGNLNTTPGTTIPTLSSTSSFDTSNEGNQQNVHVIGSSMNQQHQQRQGNDELRQLFSNQHQGNNHRIQESTNTRIPTSTIRNNTERDKHWNWLNIALFLSYGFTTASNTVPIALIPTIALDLLSREYNGGDDDGLMNDNEALSSKFASVVATYAVLGTGLGKFLNGSLGDIFGARRVSCYFSLVHSLSLLMLSFCGSSWSVICCCVAAEYYQSVQWPCIAVILAAHYGNGILGDNANEDAEANIVRQSSDNKSRNADNKYEKGIYIASLGSRSGALVASLLTTLFLRYEGMDWRAVARLASMVSTFLYKVLHSRNFL